MKKILEKLKNDKKIIKFIGLILVLALSGLIIGYSDKLKSLENYGYAGIFIINLLGSATILFPAPAFISAIVGGAIFNPLMVGIAAGTGAAIGETTGYFVGHTGQVVINNKKRYEKVKKWIEKHGGISIFFLALIPNPLFDIAGIASGMMGLPYYQFLTYTILGKTLRYILVAFLSSGSFSLFKGFF